MGAGFTRGCFRVYIHACRMLLADMPGQQNIAVTPEHALGNASFHVDLLSYRPIAPTRHSAVVIFFHFFRTPIMEKSPETQKALAVLEKFTSDQCCGKCISCREGTRQMQQILADSALPFPSQEELELLDELGALIDHTARCGLGKSIARQVLSVLEHQGGEERVIEEYLPGPYQELIFFDIDPQRCKGCSRCARSCPVNAISGVIKKPFVINHELCIKCGTCMMNCKFGAISIKD